MSQAVERPTLNPVSPQDAARLATLVSSEVAGMLLLGDVMIVTELTFGSHMDGVGGRYTDFCIPVRPYRGYGEKIRTVTSTNDYGDVSWIYLRVTPLLPVLSIPKGEPVWLNLLRFSTRRVGDRYVVGPTQENMDHWRFENPIERALRPWWALRRIVAWCSQALVERAAVR